MDRIFLDANVLFSAAYRENSRPSELWSIGTASIYSSTYAIEEAKRNLDQRDQQQRLKRLLEKLEVVSAHSVPAFVLETVDLPEKDIPILGGALSANCSHLISGDSRRFGGYFGQRIAGVLVLPPADYLRDFTRTI